MSLTDVVEHPESRIAYASLFLEISFSVRAISGP